MCCCSLPHDKPRKDGGEGGREGGCYFSFLIYFLCKPDRRRDAFYACEPAVRVRTLDSLHAPVSERTSGLGWVWGGQTVTPTDRPNGPRRGREVAVVVVGGKSFTCMAARTRRLSAVQRVANEVDRLRVAPKSPA